MIWNSDVSHLVSGSAASVFLQEQDNNLEMTPGRREMERCPLVLIGCTALFQTISAGKTVNGSSKLFCPVLLGILPLSFSTSSSSINLAPLSSAF